MKQLRLALILLTILTNQQLMISAAKRRTPIFATTIPKSGTHLLLRAIELISSRHRIWTKQQKNETLTDYRLREYFPEHKHLLSWLPHIRSGFFHQHLEHSAEYETFFKKHDAKLFFILRDPRDVLVSRVFYLKAGKRKQFPFKHLSLDELLSALIGSLNDSPKGMKSWVDGLVTDKASICNIAHLYHNFLPWIQASNCYTTRFESLVGSKGGGSDELQLQEVVNIAHHLGISLPDKEAERIAHRLFGDRLGTFRKGQIGSWKKHFKEHHKEQFKKVAGQLLIDLGYEKDFSW